MSEYGEGDTGVNPDHEDQKKEQPTINRRQFLKGVVGVAGLAGLAKLGLEVKNSTAESAPHNPLEFKEDQELATEHPVTGIMKGSLMVRLDGELKLRESPSTVTTLHDGRKVETPFYKGTALSELNGFEINGANVVAIENALIRQGADVDGISSEDGGKWICIKARIDQPGFDKEKDVYINYSSQTEGYVTPKEDAQLLDAKVEDNMLKYFDGRELKPINPDVVNKVSLPETVPPTQ